MGIVFAHAILICRFLLDATWTANLLQDNGIGVSTCYRYIHEALDVLAARAPGLRPAPLAAPAAGHTHVDLDDTFFAVDRVGVPGPSIMTKQGHHRRRVDLWWSGKQHRYGGNVQVLTAPDGWPIWVFPVSPVCPGREYDTICTGGHFDLLPTLAEFTGAGHEVLADLGYEGELPSQLSAQDAPG
jgi:hypothetical protein